MSEADIPFPDAATPEVRDFLVAAYGFCAEAKPKLTVASLSSLLFGSGRQIARLTDGNDITTGRLRAAWTKLRELEAGGPRTRKPRNSKGASDGEQSTEEGAREAASHEDQQPRRCAS